MASRLPLSGYILGLDVGDKRIGAATASVIARLPQPIEVISADEDAYKRIEEVVIRENIGLIVIGIPRNLDGAETAQSRKIRDFASELEKRVDLPVAYADESLSSVRADELAVQSSFKHISRDSLAACFILEEFLSNIDKETV